MVGNFQSRGARGKQLLVKNPKQGSFCWSVCGRPLSSTHVQAFVVSSEDLYIYLPGVLVLVSHPPSKHSAVFASRASRRTAPPRSRDRRSAGFDKLEIGQAHNTLLSHSRRCRMLFLCLFAKCVTFLHWRGHDGFGAALCVALAQSRLAAWTVLATRIVICSFLEVFFWRPPLLHISLRDGSAQDWTTLCCSYLFRRLRV